MPEALGRSGPFSVRVEVEGGFAIARLRGEFTEPDVATLARTLAELASSHKGILVDLTGVRYIPSRMIAPLVWAAMEVTFFAVVVQPGSRERVFKLVGMEKALRLYTDEGTAHAAFLASGDPCE